MLDHTRLTRFSRGWIEEAPALCPNGHELVAGRVLVGSHVCSCEVHHHRTHRCRVCDAIVYTPERGPGCEDSSFDGRASAQ